MSRYFYLLIRMVIKQTVVIIQVHHFVNYVRNFIQHPAVKFNFICKGNYWVSSVQVSTQVNC